MKNFLPLLLLLSVKTWAAPKQPIIFIPGWGPEHLISTETLRSYFREDGYPAKDLHEVNYPYRGPLDQITLTLTTSIGKIMREYPPETRFTIVTHSLGQFVGLYALVTSGLCRRVSNFVGLAGAAHGLNPKAWTLFIGGKTTKLLMPHNNPFIRKFMEDYALPIGALKKCSLFSSADKILNDPFDSGAFPDGLNLKSNTLGHMDFIKRKEAYRWTRKSCGI